MLRILRKEPTPDTGSSQLILNHAGESIVVALRRLPSARRFTLRVRFAARDAVLTMPRGASLREARVFAERHSAWIAARLGDGPTHALYVAGAAEHTRRCMCSAAPAT